MEALLIELRQEAEATRRLLERVPEDRLAWKPHPKSMTLGQLVLHVATIPGDLCRLAKLEEFDASNTNFEPPAPESNLTIEAARKNSPDDAAEYLGALDADRAGATWRLTLQGHEVFAMPCAAFLRSLMLNHWYHHVPWALWRLLRAKDVRRFVFPCERTHVLRHHEERSDAAPHARDRGGRSW